MSHSHFGLNRPWARNEHKPLTDRGRLQAATKRRLTTIGLLIGDRFERSSGNRPELVSGQISNRHERPGRRPKPPSVKGADVGRRQLTEGGLGSDRQVSVRVFVIERLYEDTVRHRRRDVAQLQNPVEAQVAHPVAVVRRESGANRDLHQQVHGGRRMPGQRGQRQHGDITRDFNPQMSPDPGQGFMQLDVRALTRPLIQEICRQRRKTRLRWGVVSRTNRDEQLEGEDRRAAMAGDPDLGPVG